MRYVVVDLYLKNVKKEVHKLYPTDSLIESMSEYLNDYCDEHPDCSVEDLEKAFGTPAEVAREFLEEKGVIQAESVEKIKRNKRIIIAALGVAVIALGVALAHFIDVAWHMSGTAVETLVVGPEHDAEDIDKLIDSTEWIEEDSKESMKEDIKEQIEESKRDLYGRES